jgi:DHA2 family multidrug resistance protein
VISFIEAASKPVLTERNSFHFARLAEHVRWGDAESEKRLAMDVFYLLTVVFASLAIFAIMMRKPPAAAGGGGGH